jgi:hypothetical protein
MTAKSSITIREQPDGSYVLTACAPRDCIGRETSACDLHYPMSREEFRRFVDDLVWMRAGR